MGSDAAPHRTRSPSPVLAALRRVRARTWLVVLLSVLLVGVSTVLAATVLDQRRWRPVFAEEFQESVAEGGFAAAYSERWSVYPDGWPTTNATGTYQPTRTVSVHDGALDIRVGTTESGPASAALVPRLPTYGQLYGKYSVRFRADPVPGYKVAFLLWPDSESWPDDGEIDFPEGELDGRISAFAHYASSSGGQDQFDTPNGLGRWQVATIEWTPGRIRFLLDDVLVGESTRDVPDTSMHWVLQTEPTPGQTPSPQAAGSIYVDWVRAWSLRD